MRVLSMPSAAALAKAAANWTAIRCAEKRDAVLALPTGTTPIGLYGELIGRTRARELDLGAARVFNLDEFRGIAADNPQSYSAFLRRHLLDALALPDAQVRLLRGDASDAAAECRAYDAAIAAAGGIDAAILGLGANGHIAFNEPGTPWDLGTHVVDLTESTRAAQALAAGDTWEIPRQGITMGIGTLRAARHVLLLIAGAHKQAARTALHRGVPTSAWPVTSLLGHPHLTVIETA